MSKIRINDLARELEVKSKAILDALPEVGVTEKKTHSSSVEEHEAEKVRVYLRGSSEAQTATKHARPSRLEERDDGGSNAARGSGDQRDLSFQAGS